MRAAAAGATVWAAAAAVMVPLSVADAVGRPLADVLDPSVNEINYWGFSYGTMLGFTFVNSESRYELYDFALTVKQCSLTASAMLSSMGA